jgi:energy-coupling factor transporter ATP-binding protein EcfA2
VRLPLRYGYPGGAFQLGPFVLEGPPDRPWLVLGPTGSGKSTVLRLLAGSLGGGGSPLRAGERPSYLPQLPERALAGRNLAEDLCGHLRPSREVRRRLRRLLTDVGLEGRLSRRSRTLSAGERRRLALALVILSGRKPWALDEPDAALDRVGQKMLLELLGGKGGDGGPLWIGTHRFALYRPLEPWAIVLSEGKIVSYGDIREVLREPGAARVLSLAHRPAFALGAALDRGGGDPDTHPRKDRGRADLERLVRLQLQERIGL